MKVTDNPLVSVIIITYNSARYVIEALESVKAQTWGNLELIVSDDGSRDQTVQLCADWIVQNKDRFSTTKLITVPRNTGISANCNRGVRASVGDWIKVISGDDILIDSAIDDNLTYTRQFPEASFIASDVREIDENGVLIRDKVLNEGLIHFSSLSTAQKQMKTYSRWPVFLNTPTFFCKREMIVKGMFLDEEFKIYEDMVMVIRALEEGYRLHYMEKPTVAYRVHGNATSRSTKLEEIRKKEGFRVFKKYLTRHLNVFNPLDLSGYYENWLRFRYKGIKGYNGRRFLRKLSLNYWYMKANGVKDY
ncbi:glycosyltransferase [Proteiniphilum sp. X52]|uniref:glycosyltransferase n=1 Tax=Proteiniphilum sp. X52 TaxID=2382159 RepID=UPI000F09ED98|nr:glycosyltransferase [Proteiniphilum sp. X52]RNC63860.1 glycosyltransferase [Proteiniphilum sp. X52]